MEYEANAERRKQKCEESLDKVLNKIYDDVVALKKTTAKKAKGIVKKLLDENLIPAMNHANGLFQKIYERNLYAGSFYDGLKINEPDEFDINVVFKPICKDFFKVFDRWSKEGEEMGIIEGHAFYCSKQSPDDHLPQNHDRYDDWKKFTNKLIRNNDGIYHLSPTELKKWFQSTMDLAMNKLRTESPSCFLHDRKNGRACLSIGDEYLHIFIQNKQNSPALTLKIEADSGMKMDIDLVPVFYFSCEKENSNVYLVPKTYQSEDLLENQWRLSYAEKEKEILDGNSAAKKVIKLLKRLRDMQGAPWKKLCSYYIKNFVMLELENENWDNHQKIGETFMSLLNKLHDNYLAKGKIPSYFDHTHNIIKPNIGDDTVNNIKQRLKYIISDIEKDPPNHIGKYFIAKKEKLTDDNSKYKLDCIIDREEDFEKNSPVLSNLTINSKQVFNFEPKIYDYGSIDHKVDYCDDREDHFWMNRKMLSDRHQERNRCLASRKDSKGSEDSSLGKTLIIGTTAAIGIGLTYYLYNKFKEEKEEDKAQERRQEMENKARQQKVRNANMERPEDLWRRHGLKDEIERQQRREEVPTNWKKIDIREKTIVKEKQGNIQQGRTTEENDRKNLGNGSSCLCCLLSCYICCCRFFRC